MKEIARLPGSFACFLPKPNVLIDDQSPAEWRGLIYMHPNQAASKTVDEYEAILSPPDSEIQQ